MPYQTPQRGELEGWIHHLEGEERSNFVKMIKSMLELDPEKRKSARELLDEPWLMDDGVKDSEEVAAGIKEPSVTEDDGEVDEQIGASEDKIELEVVVKDT